MTVLVANCNFGELIDRKMDMFPAVNSMTIRYQTRQKLIAQHFVKIFFASHSFG